MATLAAGPADRPWRPAATGGGTATGHRTGVVWRSLAAAVAVAQAGLLASSVEGLDEAGVLRTAVAQQRRWRQGQS